MINDTQLSVLLKTLAAIQETLTQLVVQLQSQGTQQPPPIPVPLPVPATQLFDEAYYLKTYEDVANAVTAGYFKSGYEHYVKHGKAEGRLSVPPGEKPGISQLNPQSATNKELVANVGNLINQRVLIKPTGPRYKGQGRLWPKAFGQTLGENFWGYAIRLAKTPAPFEIPNANGMYHTSGDLGSYVIMNTGMDYNPRYEGEWETYMDKKYFPTDWMSEEEIAKAAANLSASNAQWDAHWAAKDEARKRVSEQGKQENPPSGEETINLG
jgi:hypothetical protein